MLTNADNLAIPLGKVRASEGNWTCKPQALRCLHMITGTYNVPEVSDQSSPYLPSIKVLLCSHAPRSVLGGPSIQGRVRNSCFVWSDCSAVLLFSSRQFRMPRTILPYDAILLCPRPPPDPNAPTKSATASETKGPNQRANSFALIFGAVVVSVRPCDLILCRLDQSSGLGVLEPFIMKAGLRSGMLLRHAPPSSNPNP